MSKKNRISDIIILCINSRRFESMLINNLSFDGIEKDGKNLLKVSYTDEKGVIVEVLVKPNPTGASELLIVNWGGKIVDPLPLDNIAVLEMEAFLRTKDGNVPELDRVKFCSLWTRKSEYNLFLGDDIQRSQNMATKRYLFGRLWYKNQDNEEITVYWRKYLEKGKDRPRAFIASKESKIVEVTDEHQMMVDKLYQLIEEHDRKVMDKC